MNTTPWTASQLAAISQRDHDLLVSAGAGSGKTAVLTERIIRRLTDQEDPVSLSRLLVVTFTKAAAGELRERIEKALAKAIAERPHDAALQRQYDQIDRAKISTIDSFCLDLLRTHFAEAGLNADFRVGDQTEIKLLRKSVMEELIGDYYAEKITDEYAIEDFPSLADLFVNAKRDQTLADFFLSLESKLASLRDPEAFLGRFADSLEKDADRPFGETDCGKEILSLIANDLQTARESLSSYLPALEDNEELLKNYYPAFLSDCEFAERVEFTARKGDYAGVARAFASYVKPRLGSVKAECQTDDSLAAKKARMAFWDTAKSCIDLACLDAETLKHHHLATAAVLEKLKKLLSLFAKRFTAEKRSRSLIDFNESLRLTLSLLANPDGTKTALAEGLSEEFDEIYIDEYQDVNALQDAVFASLSRGNNRFMVGDIKQSIYGFRGSDPSIFSAYRKAFRAPDDPEATGGITIFLADNFRCDQTVIDFTNLVSDALFTHSTGRIPFGEDDFLRHAKTGAENGSPVKVAVIPKTQSGDEEESSDDPDEEISRKEAVYVAREIKDLLENGRKNDASPIRPADIAILVRSPKGYSAVLSEVFEEYGIPLHNNLPGNFFENAEILLALCLLNVIDNPTRDIYLAGLLKSPLFGFSLDDLLIIRKQKKDGSLYDAVCAFAEETGDEKCAAFLDRLSTYRRKAEGLPVDKLIWYLYTETGLPALVFDPDDAPSLHADRRANLMLLYEYARRFEGSSYQGLYQFLRYLNDILAQKAELSDAKIFTDVSDTVKLMSIHQSKGLEFPVCFLIGTGKQFNKSDLRAPILVEPSLGAASKLLLPGGMTFSDTMIRKAVGKRLEESQLEEEMRILYVAMTRARERLYVTGLARDPEKLLEKATDDAKHLSRGRIFKANHMLAWILTAMASFTEKNPDAAVPFTLDLVSEKEETEKTDILPSAESQTVKKEDPTDYDALLHEHFDFVYPRSAAAKLPAKLSVSELTPTILDTEDDAAYLEEEMPTSIREKIPLFLSETQNDRPTAAERGTATHLFMQFCSFDSFRNIGTLTLEKAVEEEIARLSEEKFITPRVASLIDRKKVVTFFESKLFAEICASSAVYREYRFNVSLPASDFTADPTLKRELSGEQILVQGVIDCFCLTESGEVLLIDYKTDHIPPTLSRKEAEGMLRERHRLQLSYYKAACEKITCRKVARVVVYSFGLGDTVEI